MIKCPISTMRPSTERLLSHIAHKIIRGYSGSAYTRIPYDALILGEHLGRVQLELVQYNVQLLVNSLGQQLYIGFAPLSTGIIILSLQSVTKRNRLKP